MTFGYITIFIFSIHSFTPVPFFPALFVLPLFLFSSAPSCHKFRHTGRLKDLAQVLSAFQILFASSVHPSQSLAIIEVKENYTQKEHIIKMHG